jgi:succinate-semialdehyde dehydrogenase/glutarate-semialdehyde dehydrogenase
MAVPPEPFAAATAHVSGVVESIDPASGIVHARFAATNPTDIPAIFERARIAQKEWAARSLHERCAMVQCLRDVIFDSRDEIANVIARETGKPRVEAMFAEIVLALDTADFLARRAPRWLRPEGVPHHNLALKAKSGWLEFEPLGVVAIISPWNYPFAIPIAQIIPALVAGNAVLLKPSELTPSTGALIGDLIGDLISKLTGASKFPPNLVQVLQGAGDTGAALIDASPDKVFFTGSVATGQRIAEACGRKLIPSVLELGGKDAMIILGDADLDTASSAAVWGSFTNCGQACLSVERIYVEREVAERFTALCVQKTAKLRLGPPSDADAEVGPMIRLRQLEKVEEHLREAVSRGAKILFGGHRRPDLGPNFLEPGVIANVDHSMKIMREETFGPVLAIQAVDSVDEAIALANDSPFALSGSIWTADARRGRELASHLRAGSVMVNDVASYYGISEAPHGGRGASGWGRAHSRFGLLEMVHTKYVDVDRLPHVAKAWWFGYTSELGFAADRFVDLLFARSWRRRFSALTSRPGARSLIFRRDRI